MHDTNIIFAENSWWICAGFLVIFASICFLAIRAWKLRHSGQSVILLGVVIGGVWLLGLYADKAFASFTRLERRGATITFHYYFGWSREFGWQDVQSIAREPSGKNHSRIRFVFRGGTQAKSFDTDDEGVIADTLSLREDIQTPPPLKPPG
jgi:hypothetical protein